MSQNIKFRAFASLMFGMTCIGISMGYVFGYFFSEYFQQEYWAYLAAPVLGLGSGLIVYGTLYDRNIQEHDN